MMQASAIARSHSSRYGSAVAIALVLLIDAAAAAPETLTVDGRKLLMDGKPWVMRGVTYAPTPVGNDPGWGRGSTADYHSTDYSDIHARDIDLLEEMSLGFQAYSSGRCVVPPVGELLLDQSLCIGHTDQRTFKLSNHRWHGI